MWLSNHFMKVAAKASLNSRTTHKANNASKDDKLTSYFETVSHLLKTKATDDIIATAENGLLKVLQNDRMFEEENAAAL